jgi:hypothetical protein
MPSQDQSDFGVMQCILVLNKADIVVKNNAPAHGLRGQAAG